MSVKRRAGGQREVRLLKGKSVITLVVTLSGLQVVDESKLYSDSFLFFNAPSLGFYVYLISAMSQTLTRTRQSFYCFSRTHANGQ